MNLTIGEFSTLMIAELREFVIVCSFNKNHDMHLDDWLELFDKCLLAKYWNNDAK